MLHTGAPSGIITDIATAIYSMSGRYICQELLLCNFLDSMLSERRGEDMSLFRLLKREVDHVPVGQTVDKIFHTSTSSAVCNTGVKR